MAVFEVGEVAVLHVPYMPGYHNHEVTILELPKHRQWRSLSDGSDGEGIAYLVEYQGRENCVVPENLRKKRPPLADDGRTVTRWVHCPFYKQIKGIAHA